MTKIPLKSAKNKSKSSFLWGLIQFAPNSNIMHLVYSHKNVPTELPRSGSSTDTLQKCHIWQLCPSDIGLTKKKLVKQFLIKNFVKNHTSPNILIFKRKIKIWTSPNFFFSKRNWKSGHVQIFYFQGKNKNPDTSRFLFLNAKF